MYRLAVFDLDGTLLNEENEISDANMKALKLLQDKGCGIVLATGRPDLLAKEYIKKLELKDPMIACNGAVVRNPFTNKEFLNQTLPPQIVQDVLEICKRGGHHFMLYTRDVIIASPNVKAAYFIERNKELADDCKVPIEIVETGTDLAEKYEVNKVLILEYDQEKFNEIPNKLKSFNGITFCQSNTGHMDIMVEGVSKKNGLRILAEAKGINPEDIVVFGDNHNDLEMMTYGACAITMENGVKEAKIIADYISIHHNLDGVAYAIHNYLLI